MINNALGLISAAVVGSSESDCTSKASGFWISKGGPLDSFGDSNMGRIGSIDSLGDSIRGPISYQTSATDKTIIGEPF